MMAPANNDIISLAKFIFDSYLNNHSIYNLKKLTIRDERIGQFAQFFKGVDDSNSRKHILKLFNRNTGNIITILRKMKLIKNSPELDEQALIKIAQNSSLPSPTGDTPIIGANSFAICDVEVSKEDNKPDDAERSFTQQTDSTNIIQDVSDTSFRIEAIIKKITTKEKFRKTFCGKVLLTFIQFAY